MDITLKQQELLDILKDDPTLSYMRIARKMGLSLGAVQSRADQLMRLGLVEYVKNPVRWRVTSRQSK